MKGRKEESTKTVNKGFTLIELLVVVLIIGILAAIALPKYRQAVDKSDFMCIMSVLKTLTDAQQVAALARGSYPSSPNYFKFSDLDIDIPGMQSSCINSEICSLKCGRKTFNVVLRNNETWGNFYFWSPSSIERIRYASNGKYHLECKTTRCEKLAASFGAIKEGYKYVW